MSNDIPEFSKIDAGEMILERIEFSLRATIEQLLDEVRARAAAKNLYLQAWYEAGTPERLCGDVDRLRQIVVNLLGNAIRFTSRGGVLVRVSGDATVAGRARLRIAVEDTGIGIAPEQWRAICDEFMQAGNSTARVHGGSGLGISRQLAQALGGTIELDSAPGQGSTFMLTLELPVAPAPALKEPASGSAPQAARILVVGDCIERHRLTERWCRQWGYVPEYQPSIAEALLALPGVPPFQLIIADNVLGQRAVEDFAAQVRASSALKRLPLVLLTCMPATAAQAAGFDVQLSRPLQESQLRRVIADRLAIGPVNAASLATAAPTAAEPALGRFRVLLADDNPVNRKVATRMLEQLGGSVDVAVDGREAVEAWSRLPCELILMDCNMPELDGYAATREIRRIEAGRGGRVTIVALTANAQQGEREACLAAGMDDFLTKPIRLGDLEQLLRRHVDLPAGPASDKAPPRN